MNTTHHRHTSLSRIERLLARLADHRDTSPARVDLIHDIHAVPVPLEH